MYTGTVSGAGLAHNSDNAGIAAGIGMEEYGSWIRYNHKSRHWSIYATHLFSNLTL